MSDDVAAGTPPARTSAQRADLVASVALLALLAIATPIAAYLALFIGFTSDACGPDCAFGLIDAGVGIAMLGLVLVLGGIGAATVLRLRRRRLAWWLPAAGFALLGGVHALGWIVAGMATR